MVGFQASIVGPRRGQDRLDVAFEGRSAPGLAPVGGVLEPLLDVYEEYRRWGAHRRAHRCSRYPTDGRANMWGSLFSDARLVGFRGWRGFDDQVVFVAPIYGVLYRQ